MPVRKVGSKWAIGSGKAIYKNKKTAERAYRGYLASKRRKTKRVRRRKRRAKRRR